MEQHIANIINHYITTGEEGLGPTSLNTKRVGAALRDVFPLQAALGLDVPPQSSTCSAERAPGAFAAHLGCSELTAPNGVQLSLSELFPSAAKPCAQGPQGKPGRVTGIISAVRGCAKQA